jgi:mono/diheme cytochrome c family protein
MLTSVTRNLVLSIAVLALTVSIAKAQDKQPPPKKAANVPIELSGRQIFTSYCAPCHGKDAKGSGPIAPALTVPPPDLTTLSKRNNGKFPADYFATVLKNGVNAPAHGSVEMPIWGSTFADAKTQRIVTIRVNDLIQYLESLQAK